MCVHPFVPLLQPTQTFWVTVSIFITDVIALGHIRQPVAYGFYPPGRAALEESLRSSFLNKFGTGQIPSVNPERQGRVIAGVAPHAGYVYSGAIAAHIYEALAKDGFPETFVLIGPKHGFMRFEGGAIMTTGAWSTPLGECPIDLELAKTILECGQASSPRCITDSEDPHLQEHSLEVQLPFIQFLSKEQLVKIVPIVLSTIKFSTCKTIGEAVAAAIQKSNRDVALIASTDFTHYGKYYYNYAPVGSGPVDKVVKWVYETDGDLIRRIEKLDAEMLMKTVVDEHRTMCGSNAVATVIEAARMLGASKGKLLKYATSYDVSGNPDAIVGYAALEIKR